MLSGCSTSVQDADVYFIHGFAGNNGLPGMAEMTKDAKAMGINAINIPHYGFPKRNKPTILIGRSMGADQALEIASDMNARKVEVPLLILIDPFCPKKKVPINVKKSVLIRGWNLGHVACDKEYFIYNTNHFEIAAHPKVKEIVKNELARVKIHEN